MCFSPEMDATAGVLVTAIGLDAMRQVTRPRDVALAALPILFGVHQFIETFVWLHLQGHVGQACGDTAAYAYLVIAFVIVPIAVPLAFLLQRSARWPALDWAFLAAGVVAATFLARELGLDPGRRLIEGHQISYLLGSSLPQITLTVYVFACCGPALLSRSRPLQWFGVLNLVVVIALAALNQRGVISLWCVWAAATSILVNVHLRGVRRGLARSDVQKPQDTSV